jgi:16S rRNA (guanine(1405)-N(7))-methyltransferase
VDAVCASAKYNTVCPDLIAHIGTQELQKRRNLKAAIKSTKSKLHQVAGAYVGNATAYEEWLARLAAAPSADAQRAVCADILAHHASTRERLPILPRFYTTLLRDLPPITTVADLACGLNPLTWPWMADSGGMAPSVTYHAYDVYSDLAAFLDRAFDHLALRGEARAVNLLQNPPRQHFDLALLLKAVPCLEQLDKNAGRFLLESIDASVLMVSFPVQSLGGRSKGMAAHYAAHFDDLVRERPWAIDVFEFESELVYRIRK